MFTEVHNLILNERNEGRDDDGQPRGQKSRQLVREGFPAPGGHDTDDISPVHTSIAHPGRCERGTLETADLVRTLVGTTETVGSQKPFEL